MEVGPQLWDGELTWVLGEESLEDDVEGSASDAEEVASKGLEVRDDCAAFRPLFLFFEVNDAIWDREILSEAPCVACAKAGGNVADKVFVYVGGLKCGHRCKEFGCMPGGERSGKVLTGAENAELL